MTRGPGPIRAWFMRRAYEQGYADAIADARELVRRKEPPRLSERQEPPK